MSLCDALEGGESLADLILAADATGDERENLRLLLQAVEKARTVKGLCQGARARLTAAAASFAHPERHAPQALNDNHREPSPHDPLIA